MPLREGQPHEVSLAPAVFLPSQSLWICRYTGALFPNYEEYLKTLAGYRVRTWGCKHTGATDLSFEEALASETRSQVMLDQFPICYEEAVARLVHHATLKQEELSQRIVSYFKDHFVEGEELFAIRDEKEAALRISACQNTAEKTHDSQMLSVGAILPPDPEDEFLIEWLSDYTSATVKRKDLIRHQLPLTRATVKSWLQLSAQPEALQGIKGIACIWHVKESLCKEYNLDEELSGSLKERLERAQQRKEQAKRPKPELEDAIFAEDIGNLIDGEADDRDGGPNYVPGPGSRKARTSVSRPANNTTEAGGKVLVPVETASQVKARQPAGSLKRVIYEALEEAGKSGLTTAEITDAVQASKVRTWENVKSAHSSINATCSHDLAFKRIAQGRFALRMLLDKQMQVASNSAMVKDQGPEGGAQAAAQQAERNNFKCSKCLKSHVPENSPLVLCDGCPRSYHLSCLGLTFEELPEEDWHCPKCQDRKTSTGRRITNSAYKADIYERFDSDREDGALRTTPGADQLSLSTEKVKEDPRVSRERARIAARWAALHPVDDLETLEEEEIKLAASEAEAQVIAEEAERAAAKPNPKNDQRHADRVARLYRKAEAAKKRAAALRLVIEGPPSVVPGADNSRSMTALYDALAIVDFITMFGASFEAPPFSLLDMQQMTAYPLETPHLGQCYIALLRCLLLEAMSMEGVVKSRAKRWTHCLDSVTWPEILRRYLLASRVGMTLPEHLRDADESLDTSNIDDDSACMIGARLLSKIPYFRLPAGLHLRIMASLCSDVADCTLLRNEVNARIEEMNQLQAEFRQRQMEGKKRLKTEAAKPVITPTTDANIGPDLQEDIKADDQAQELAEGENKAKNEDSPQNGESPRTEKDAGKGNANQPGDSDEEISTASEGEEKDAKVAIQRVKKSSNPNSEGIERKDSHNAQPEPPASQTALNGQSSQKELAEPAAEDSKPELPDTTDAPASKAPEPIGEQNEAGVKEDVKEDLPPVKEEEGAEDNPQSKDEDKAENKDDSGLPVAPRKGKRKTRKKAEMQKKKSEAAALQAQERQFEEELREREIALDDALDARAIRGEPLGQDRHHRSYWWYPGEPAVVFVEEADGSGLGVLEHPEDLLNLMDRLNQNGLRERALFLMLQKRYDSILNSLGHRFVNLDVRTAPRPLAEVEPAQLVDGAEREALNQSVKKLEAFLDQFNSISASPMTTSVADWKERLSSIQNSRDLVTVALELEADINDLGTGLPTGGDDASLAGFSKRKKSQAQPQQAAVETATRPSSVEPTAAATPPVADSAAAEPDPLKDSHPHEVERIDTAGSAVPNGVSSNGGAPAETAEAAAVAQPEGNQSLHSTSGIDQVPEKSVVDETAPAAINHIAQDPAAAVTKLEISQAPPAQLANGFPAPQPEDRVWAPMPPAQYVAYLFTNEPTVALEAPVVPHDELDASDTEASKNKRGGMVWRSARERRVWLKDANSAMNAHQTSEAAYVVAALVDRSQQLLRSLERANKRAEREAMLDGMDVGISDDDEKTEDDMPKKEATPVPAAEPKAERLLKPRNSAKQQDGDSLAPRASSRKTKRSSDAGLKANGGSAPAPPPPKRPRLSAKAARTSNEQDEAAKLIEDVMAIANGGVPPPAQTWIPTEQGRWSSTCQLCGEPGDLLCCDAPDCTVAQHIACAGLDDAPDNDTWFCETHKNKPSLKRARSAAKRAATPPVPIPPARKPGGKGKNAQTGGGESARKGSAKKRRGS